MGSGMMDGGMTNMVWLLLLCMGVQRLIEMSIAKRNERWMKKRGGYEVGREHYLWLVLLHISFMLSIIIEVYVGDREPAYWWYVPLLIYALLQPLRVWIIRTLGRQWNTRIIILDDAPLITKGLYRYVRHPNYIVVTLEIITFPLIFQAYGTAVVFTVLNLYLLLWIRIPTEERALRSLENKLENTQQEDGDPGSHERSYWHPFQKDNAKNTTHDKAND